MSSPSMDTLFERSLAPQRDAGEGFVCNSASTNSSPKFDVERYQGCKQEVRSSYRGIIDTIITLFKDSAPDKRPSVDSPPALTSSDSLSSSDSSNQNTNKPPLPSGEQKLASSTSNNSTYKAIRCGRLGSSVTVEQLRNHFLLCPGLQYAYLPLKKNGRVKNYGMVSFEDSTSAQVAQKIMNGTKLSGKALNLVLTCPMTPAEIRLSRSADPLALSERDMNRITVDAEIWADIDSLRLRYAKDLPVKRKLSQKIREERSNPRVQNLAKLLGVEDAIPTAMDLDKIVQDIDKTYHHESETRRNSRIWNIQFEYFGEAAAKVLSFREAFKDKDMFKPSPDDEVTTKSNREALLGWMTALYENVRKLRSLEKLFNKDVKFPPREELSFELKLRYTRGSIVHAFRSGPNLTIDWDDSHEVCFAYTDELLGHMAEYKALVHKIYRRAIVSEQSEESFNPVFRSREWAISPMNPRQMAHSSSESKQSRYQNERSYSNKRIVFADHSFPDGTGVEDGYSDEDVEDGDLDSTDLEDFGLENRLLGGIVSEDEVWEDGKVGEGELGDD
ncbi:hypothetical protein BKA65DRAFT_557266 [Rhexocercosporidium sp. MPI-PUGE-AT-0058]|nr:hypothetical protein BKA65DRAFT_557266 [Rhexocercosporidium sp. MPI-PUGE-AT-0058]